jgi:hypothetical protein
LRNREILEAIQHRRQQLVQPGEGELHLRLDTRGPHHTAARRLPDHVIQQRRLAHARFATHHQCPALTPANGVDEAVEYVAFGAPADELCGASSDVGMCGHLPGTDRTPVPTGGDE